MAKGKAGLELKKEILLALGKIPIIKDQKLLIEPNEWFAPINNGYPSLEKEYLRLEPTKVPMNKAKTEALASVRARWLPELDAFRTREWEQIVRSLQYLGVPRLAAIA